MRYIKKAIQPTERMNFMKKNILKIFVIALLVGTSTNCITNQAQNSMQSARLTSFIDIRSLSRGDYKVIGQAEGKATVTTTRYLVLLSSTVRPIPYFEGNHKRGHINGFSTMSLPTARGRATMEATYNAIESVPNADMLLQPRTSWNCEIRQYILFSVRTCEVTVKGKAISINAG